MTEGFWYRQNLIAKLPRNHFDVGMKSTLWAMSNFVGNNAEGWPSRPALAKATGVKLRAIGDIVKKLVELGVIAVAKGGGRSRTNAYSFDLARMAELIGNPDTVSLFEGELNSAPDAPFTESETELNSASDDINSASDDINSASAAPQLTRTNKEQPISGSVSSPRRGKRRTAAKKKSAPAPIPEALDTPEFHAAWAEWQQHKKELRKPLTPTAANRLLPDLVEWGESRAIAAIHYSIKKSWAGVFEQTGGSTSTTATADFEAVRQVVSATYTPDVNNIDDVQEKLTAEQFAAAVSVGIRKIYNSRAPYNGIATDYTAAWKATT